MGRKRGNSLQGGAVKEHKNGAKLEEEVAVGCPIPLGCELARAVKPGDASVQMECDNAGCPYKNQPVHRHCLDELERKLLQRLEITRPSIEWAEKRRRANLWRWKGFRIHQCQCLCGSFTRPPMDEVEKKPKGQKPTKTSLPTVQTFVDNRQTQTNRAIALWQKEQADAVVPVERAYEAHLPFFDEMPFLRFHRDRLAAPVADLPVVGAVFHPPPSSTNRPLLSYIPRIKPF